MSLLNLNHTVRVAVKESLTELLALHTLQNGMFSKNMQRLNDHENILHSDMDFFEIAKKMRLIQEREDESKEKESTACPHFKPGLACVWVSGNECDHATCYPTMRNGVN